MKKTIALLGTLALAAGASSVKAAPPERFMGYNTYAPNAETLRRFAEAGVNTVVCFPANVLASTGEPYNSVYPPIWNGPGIYDFECLDRQVTDKLAVHPKAKLIFFIDLNTPTWWCRIRGASDSFNELGRVAPNHVWRRDTREYLQAVLRHLESNHRDVIVGYFLAGGKTIEWQDFNKGEASATGRAAWRRWMIERGQPDPVDIPPASVRDHVSHGPFRDPVDDAPAIHYWRFSHELISDLARRAGLRPDANTESRREASPTIVADMERLQQQLRELHAGVKAQSVQRQDQADQTAGAGMVIRGK